jgi:NADPH:quinone reductase-like Zn-dependent oxidoreductase
VALDVAAAAALVYQTAWRMVTVRGGLRAGQWVLVNGAGGGVSTAAVQIAKLHGAHVIATTSTADKERKARELGADYVLNYRTQQVDREVYRITGKRGVDLVVDNVGRDTWKANVRALARGGKLAICGGTSGNDPPAMVNVLYWKQITVLGSTMGNWHDFENVMRLVFNGTLKPVIDTVVPVASYRQAFTRLAAGEQFGKVLVRP